nr:Rop guanine nucleotide exchange factor 5-like [Tanacetum cinerariifolium]
MYPKNAEEKAKCSETVVKIVESYNYVGIPGFGKNMKKNLDLIAVVDQGIVAPEADTSSSVCKLMQVTRRNGGYRCQVPRVPAGGLKDDTRKHTQT